MGSAGLLGEVDFSSLEDGWIKENEESPKQGGKWMRRVSRGNHLERTHKQKIHLQGEQVMS